MMMQPCSMAGAKAPLFVLHGDAPYVVVAWNEPVVVMTGISADDARGCSLARLFGMTGSCDVEAARDGVMRLPGLGRVRLVRQGEFLLAHGVEARRDPSLGLAARDLRAPLLAIMAMADEARRDVLGAEALLTRIKQVARQGIAVTDDLLAEARGAPDASRRAVVTMLRGFCEDLAAKKTCPLHVQVPDAAILVDRALLTRVLGALFELTHPSRDRSSVSLHIDVEEKSGCLCFTLRRAPQGFVLPGRAVVPNGGRGQGLLALRRTVRLSGGSLTLSPEGNGPGRAILLTLPGVLVEDGRSRLG